MKFQTPKQLKKGDKVAILSPSFAAPGKWPWVHELGLKRLKEDFGLEPVEFPTTRKIGATGAERSADLVAAFEDPQIKAVIATLGGNDQVTYVKYLPSKPFVDNPKPFFGYSDNTNFMNFLWLNGIPSYYGGSLFTQFAQTGKMNEYTVNYLKKALFEEGEFEIEASKTYSDVGLDWNDPKNLDKESPYEPNTAWIWDSDTDAEGITWGGCVESIEEMLAHGITIPLLDDFEQIILIMETSEEIPPAEYVFRLFRALGEREILSRIKGVLIGRPKAWEFDKPWNAEQKKQYREKQRETIISAIRLYNQKMPVVQNLDFGHTEPQIPFPYGKKVRIDSANKKIFVTF